MGESKKLRRHGYWAVQIGNGTADNARSNAMTVLQNGNTGIGTTTPLGLLHVKNGAVLADGIVGATPVSGAGTRMMWIPEKAAFRSGSVSADKPLSWNADSIGMNSFAAGYNAVASGNTSIALGVNNAATGYSAIAFGNGVRASGHEALATGNYTHASGNSSTAMGYHSVASGNASLAIGEQSIASGHGSFATGFFTEASGPMAFSGGEASRANNYVSLSFGRSSVADGSISTALGYYTKSKHFSGLVIGTYNDSSNSPNPSNINQGNRLFQIGNGSADNARSNAMTVLQNGNIGIGETNPVVPLNFNNSSGGKISLWGTSGNQYGFGIQASLLQIYTDISNSDIAFGHGNSGSFTEKVRIKGNGNMGIGQSNPTSPLHFGSVLGNKIALFGTTANHYGMGIQNNLLQIYADGINADIAFGYGNSNNFTERVRIKGIGNMEVKSGLTVLGSVAVAGNLTIENGKGIIRSTGTQTLKKVTTQVSVSANINNSTGITANFTFPETFSALPEAYVGNIVTNSSNGEYMVMTLTNLTAAGGTLNIYNPRSGGGFSSVIFTVNIIAMGPQ
jgi:Head domain of trimeric autotransporter adhesin